MDTRETLLPDEGRLVSIIGTVAGKAEVFVGTVLGVAQTSLIVEAESGFSDHADGFTSLKLMYFLDQTSFTLEIGFSEWLTDRRALLAIRSNPKAGERREFVRTDAQIRAKFFLAPDYLKTEDEIEEYVLGLKTELELNPPDMVTADISGSGICLSFDKPLKKNDLLLTGMAMEVSEDTGQRIMVVSGRVVRVKKAGELFEIAVEFLNMDLNDSDVLHALVFATRIDKINRL